MKTFITDIFPKLQRFSKKLDQLTLLTNQHWVSLTDITDSKTVFIFRGNNQILISENGIVEKGCWEYIGNHSILLERQSKSFLLKHAFVDENILALKLDSSNEYVVFINETKYGKEINNIEDIIQYLETKYLRRETIVQSNFVNLKTPEFKEIEPIESYSFINGKHFIIGINFENGLKGEIYLGGKSKNFYLQYGFNGIQYFDSKKECIDFLYKQVSNSLNNS